MAGRRRFHVPTSASTILLEAGADPPRMADLESRGDIVGKMTSTGSAVRLIAFENGRKLPASDPLSADVRDRTLSLACPILQADGGVDL
jgi:hypothetical protein